MIVSFTMRFDCERTTVLLTDDGVVPGPTTVELDEIKTLKRKVKDLEETNEILKAASIFFARELDLATAGPVGANH